jgi:hypothetical protein
MLAVNSCLLLGEIAENGGGGAFPSRLQRPASSPSSSSHLPNHPIPLPQPNTSPVNLLAKADVLFGGRKSSASLPPVFLVIFNLLWIWQKPFGPKKLFLALQKFGLLVKAK